MGPKIPVLTSRRIFLNSASHENPARQPVASVPSTGREAVVYVRVSSKEQQKEGFSIPASFGAQIARIEQVSSRAALLVTHALNRIARSCRNGLESHSGDPV